MLNRLCKYEECRSPLPTHSKTGKLTRKDKEFCSVACANRAWGDRFDRTTTRRWHKNTFRHEVTVTEVAWLAGLIEGEGCMYPARHRLASGEANYRPVLRVVMTDEDVVRQAMGVFALGYVNDKTAPSRPAHHKQQYVWSVTRPDQFLTIIGAIWPYLGARRREQAKRTVAMWRASPLPECPA